MIGLGQQMGGHTAARDSNRNRKWGKGEKKKHWVSGMRLKRAGAEKDGKNKDGRDG